MDSAFRGRNILITGGAGAFGQKLIEHLKKCSPASVTVFSRDEMKHAQLKRSVGQTAPWLRCRLGDITQADELDLAISGADIVIHAAALKHLPECEANPLASNRVNVLGTEQVVKAFLRSSAETLIFLSTDKAPYASSIYGAQKYLGEKLVLEADRLASAKAKNAFCLRYSNVIDSTGAAFNIFANLLSQNKKVSVNGSTTVRGFVTQAQVIALIETALRTLKGGEILVPKPKVIRISELASSMRDLLNRGEVEVTESSSFQGEKDSATLIMAEEMPLAKSFPEAENDTYLLDFAGKHQSRAAATFAKPLVAGDLGAFTLEDCETLSGGKLNAFLRQVMLDNGLNCAK